MSDYLVEGHKMSGGPKNGFMAIRISKGFITNIALVEAVGGKK